MLLSPVAARPSTCEASPNASIAAGDAAEPAFRRKLHRYRKGIPELAAAGIVFRPMVWTTCGRPHPAVTRTLKFASEQAAHRSESAEPKAILGRWRHEIQVALLRRRAAMARAVLPQMGDREAWLLTGYCGAVPASDRRTSLLTGTIEAEGQCDEAEDPGHSPDFADEAGDLGQCDEDFADVPRPDAADSEEAPRAERWSDDVDM